MYFEDDGVKLKEVSIEVTPPAPLMTALYSPPIGLYKAAADCPAVPFLNVPESSIEPVAKYHTAARAPLTDVAAEPELNTKSPYAPPLDAAVAELSSAVCQPAFPVAESNPVCSVPKRRTIVTPLELRRYACAAYAA